MLFTDDGVGTSLALIVSVPVGTPLPVEAFESAPVGLVPLVMVLRVHRSPHL